MKLTLYQVDAFTDRLFKGNPAAIIPLEKWIDESLMQELAMENNLAETAFFVPDGPHYHIRWFTPEAEINLCGHATLASAYVLYNILGYKKPSITFNSQSGPLIVSKEKDLIHLDFPSWKPERINDRPDGLEEALGVKEIVGVYKSRDLLVELNTEDDVRNAKPDFGLIKKMGYKVIITAPGQASGRSANVYDGEDSSQRPDASSRSKATGRSKASGRSANLYDKEDSNQRPDALEATQRPDAADFVSRFFAPTFGIDEDPVTGSAHSQLIPFWSEKLNKKKMQAKQLSKRGGHLWVEQMNDRVKMGGYCVFYMKGEITLAKS